MTIEGKRKYMVWVLETGSACPVYAYMENGKVVAYHYEGDSEIEMPKGFIKFFDTENEADEYVTKRIAELKAKAKETKAILEELNYWEDKYDDGGETVTLDDYIPYCVQKRYKTAEDKHFNSMINALARCARDRVLEVADRSIPMDSISNIEWYNHELKATIVLHDGIRITIDKNNGYDLLEKLYDHKRK